MIDVASLVRVESKTLIEKEKGRKEKKNPDANRPS